jgi:hypothetical protein
MPQEGHDQPYGRESKHRSHDGGRGIAHAEHLREKVEIRPQTAAEINTKVLKSSWRTSQIQ